MYNLKPSSNENKLCYNKSKCFYFLLKLKLLHKMYTFKIFNMTTITTKQKNIYFRASFFELTLYRKVQAVEQVFRGLEKDMAAFKRATNLKCVSDCGRCCHKLDINTSILEFLPLAYHLYKQGVAFEWYQNLGNLDSPLCHAFSPIFLQGNGGMCSQYKYRGLVCRLFGFSAKLDKYGVPQMVTCKTIKDQFPKSYQNAVKHLSDGRKTPIMRNYYFQLQAIDCNLCADLLPINQAMREAIKVVLSYYAYRNPRSA